MAREARRCIRHEGTKARKPHSLANSQVFFSVIVILLYYENKCVLTIFKSVTELSSLLRHCLKLGFGSNATKYFLILEK